MKRLLTFRRDHMPETTLYYGNKQRVMTSGVTTVGRASDNDVSFPEDSNVSRYHAEIELRGTEYCLIDLGSSNGTAVNSTPVDGEVFLSPGDVIVLGGTSEIRFGDVRDEAASTAPPEISSAASSPPAVVGAAAASTSAPAPSGNPAEGGGSGKLLLIAAAICCIAIFFVIAAGAVYYFSGSSCSATASFITPEQGETISKPTEIELSMKNGGCVVQAVFTVDGRPFAAVADSPFTAVIEPQNFPDLADGVDHRLGVILVDADGNQMPQESSVRVGFETRRLTQPEPKEVIIAGPGQQLPAGDNKKELSIIQAQQLSNALAARFSGGRSYNVSNPQFLRAVQSYVSEYAKPGFFARAMQYRDAINVAYVREQNLDASLGFLLAMSRSKFEPEKKSGKEGLWQMSSDFVTANGYNGSCGSEQLTAPEQNCAARASAVYMKALVLGVFEGDMLLSVAAFGKSPQEAGDWRSKLPTDRTDIWNAIKTPTEREQLARFFAAGIVADDPGRFGLTSDRPLAELYRLTL